MLTGLKRKLRDGTVDLQLRPPLDTLVVRWKPSCTLSTLLKSLLNFKDPLKSPLLRSGAVLPAGCGWYVQTVTR